MGYRIICLLMGKGTASSLILSALSRQPLIGWIISDFLSIEGLTLLPFLDSLVLRPADLFSFSLYRKLIYTGMQHMLLS